MENSVPYLGHDVYVNLGNFLKPELVCNLCENSKIDYYNYCKVINLNPELIVTRTCNYHLIHAKFNNLIKNYFNLKNLPKNFYNQWIKQPYNFHVNENYKHHLKRLVKDFSDKIVLCKYCCNETGMMFKLKIKPM